MLRWGSRIYVHLTVIVGMRIMDWGVGRLERNVVKPIYIRDSSGVLALAMHGQNGCIWLMIVS